MFKGNLYLDQESLAIVAADFEYNPELIHKEPGLFMVSGHPGFESDLYGQVSCGLQEHGRIHYYKPGRAEVEMKVRKKRKWFGVHVIQSPLKWPSPMYIPVKK